MTIFKSLICPFSISFRLLLTGLIIVALGIQSSSVAVSSIMAKALIVEEQEVDFDTNPLGSLELVQPVEYRSISIEGEEELKTISRLKAEIGPDKMKILLKLNRLDERHLRKGVMLIIPESIDALTDFSPFPKRLEAASNTPKLILASLRVQAFGAYEYGELKRWGPISSGKKSTPTPTGAYHTNWKSRLSHSSVNNEWILPWCFNLDSVKGIAFHQYDLPGYPASHGCLRLLEEDAEWIYGWADEWTLSADHRKVEAPGTPVIVYGQYDYKKPAPWKNMATDSQSASVTEIELDAVVNTNSALLAKH